jgi:molybdopterin molybdotransferase
MLADDMANRAPAGGAFLESVGNVLALVLEHVGPLPAESVPLPEAFGLVLADDVAAAEPLPRFDNAAMDGFAVRVSDLSGATADAPVTLPVTGASMAGVVCGVALAAGSAVRVATGAALPVGADAVVRLEDTEDDGERARFRASPEPGTNIRLAGEDVTRGDLLLRAGTPVGPGQVALAAAEGLERVSVHRRPRVSVIVTGDEVAAEGAAPGEAQVRDAIGPTLVALLGALGCRPFLRGPVADDPSEVMRALREEARSADVVVTVGGVSVGPRDHVRTALEETGGRVLQVAVRPGKPFGLARIDDALVCGLPGNPVSALVAFELFVRPALATMLGRSAVRESVPATLTESFKQRNGRLHLVRAWLERDRAQATVRPLGPHGAGSLGSLAGANAWMVVPPDVERLETGTVVETWPMLPS